MAVPEQTPYIEHTGNGVATSFSLGFQCESKDHLIVLVDEIEPPIATWSLTGGNVVFTTAPAAGKKITVQRNTPFSRTTDYQSYNNSFRPPAVNKDFDWIWLKLQELGVADWILGARIDALKNYVDRKDDELKAYLMEETRKQGVALDQLDDYYNYLMQRLAQIAADKGWDASFVVDGDENQHQINKKTIRHVPSVSEMLSTPKLEDGMRVFVKSTVEPNYALAKPFVGSGEFVYVSSKSTINDGGIIVNGWVRVFDEVQLEFWGARPDGSADASSALSSAISFILNNRIAINSTANGGLYPLKLNGIYRIDSGNHSILNTNGLIIKGNSLHSSKLVFTAKSGTFLNISNYQNMTVRDCSILNGSIAISAGKPIITQYLDSTATAMKFDGRTGGTVYLEHSVQYFGWGIVYDTKSSTINSDNHIHNQSIWRWNRCVWDNTNVNAVCWAFNNCQAYFNDVVFKNPCNTTMFIGGDYINHGTLFKVDVAGHGNNMTLDGLRIEPYDNSGTGKTLTIFDVSVPIYKMTCRNINMAGVGDPIATNRVIGKFKNWFNITFEQCELVGVFEVDVDTRRKSLTSKFRFDDCLSIPTINQTKFPAIGNYLMNVDLVNHRVSSDAGWINRSYSSQHFGPDLVANGQMQMVDQFAITSEVINASSGTAQTITIPVLNPYELVVSRIEVMMTNNSSVAVTYSVYADAARTLLIGTGTSKTGRSGKQQVFDLVLTDQKSLTSADSKIYIQASSADNAGLVKSKVNVHLTNAIL